MPEITQYHPQLTEQLIHLLESSRYQLSDILPADWAEANMTVKKGNFQGPLSYNRTPYSREIINTLSPYHPAEEIVLKGGSQWGKTVSVIEPAIAFLISEHPSEMAYMTGHSELSEEAMEKLDNALDNSGVGKLIRKVSLRKSNRRTGDTTKYKEFPGGSLISGSATNHKMLRQRSWKYVFPDDIEAAKRSSKESGDTISLIRARTDSFGHKRKIFWCSTPELLETSIINELYLEGDQRLYNIPCQCCGVFIPLLWNVPIIGSDDKEQGGMFWKLDKSNLLVPGSVEYICQVCGHGFNERNKYEFNLAGLWQPTAEAKRQGLISFQLSRLYAQPGMTGWEDNVRQYLEACPPGQPRKENKYKTFVNLVLGEPYEDPGTELSANALQANQRDYEVGIIPERLSISDGNGKIVLVTCGADLNGVIDDGRLDYEIVAWAENGANYSIAQGSIGTFVPAILKRKGDEKIDRKKWTYEENKDNSIWPEFDRILQMQFEVDVADGCMDRKMTIMITALDTGNTYKNHAYTYIDNANAKGIWVEGVKGKADEQYLYLVNKDHKNTKKGVERDRLFILDVGYIKDDLAVFMGLNWKRDADAQPAGFMNFPQPANGLYGWPNFFSHFESEKRVMAANNKGTDVKAQWVKKNSASQNHHWDCRIYNLAIRDIYISILAEKYTVNGQKIKDFDWLYYVKLVLSSPAYKQAA